jgi:hypothetical protein
MTITYGEAHTALEQGKYIARRDWDGTHFLYMKDDKRSRGRLRCAIYLQVIPYHRLNGIFWKINQDDTSADDWEIVNGH